MPDLLEAALEIMQGQVGQQTWQSEWFEVKQERINDYAEVSMDHQWIHVDVERSKKGQYGTTIAHGNLTLAISGHLPMATVAEVPKLEGQKHGLNYGFDRIRFPAPVPAGTKIRATQTLRRAEIKGGMIETMNEVVVEAEGLEKPVMVAESIGRLVF